MAKKSTTKKVTKKKTTTKKKVSSASSAKKSTTKKVTKKTTKKAATKKTSSKKTTKKPAAKKPTTKKTTKKKTTSKKSTAKKPTTKKTTTKKPSTKKTTKKAESASSSTTKKKTTKKSSASKSSTTKKKASNPSDAASEAPKPRYRSAFGGGATDTQAAAALVESAGLKSVREQAAQQVKAEEYVKLKKSPFNKKKLAGFREILIAKRTQLIGDVTNFESEALGGQGSGSLSNMPQHMADAGSDTYDQSLNLDLATSQRKFLKEIEDAIERIDNGTYGICELLGKAISEERLEHAPWARYSIEGAREMERRGYR